MLYRGPALAFLGGAVLGGAVGWGFASRQNGKRHNNEKLELIKYIQLQDEIGQEKDKAWQAEYTKLWTAYEKLDKETVERDYEEFKAPDTDNDDMISRVEFNTYVRKYLSSFPELSEKDFPKFEEFDLDGDGKVSFDEWQGFLEIQKAQEEGKKKLGVKGADNGVYDNLMNALYEQTSQADSFTNLNKNLANSNKKNAAATATTRRNNQQAINY
jgi:Ca2+-binding EF-hand superfamily protein